MDSKIVDNKDADSSDIKVADNSDPDNSEKGIKNFGIW